MVRWLGLGAFTAVAQVQSLVRELRSCKLLRVVKTNKKQNKNKNHNKTNCDSYIYKRNTHQIVYLGTSLVVQWLRVCLPMKETRVRVLIWEDPTCRGATKPVRHNYGACALEPASHNY